MVTPTNVRAAALALLCSTPLAAMAEAPAADKAVPAAALQTCQGLADEPRLLCYDRLAAGVLPPPPVVGNATPAPATAPAATAETAPDSTTTSQPAEEAVASAAPPSSILQKAWELDAQTRRPAFTLRSYEPNYFLFGEYADRVNRQPQGATADHTAANAVDYSRTESKFQISVRTRTGGNLLLPYDSLWVGYTQSSQWQTFSPTLSRPFRATSYQPELLYVVPAEIKLPGTWALRMLGVGLVHQSNGQSDPLSRSWNRIYAMAGLDSETMAVRARVWKRIPESAKDDDNPDITSFMGRADLKLDWHVADGHDLGLTVASNLRSTNRGSVQLDYFFPASQLWGLSRNLRGYIQLFHGYGESITDYNFRRNAVGIGLALKEW